LLDMLAAVARRDYVDRRRGQAQGQGKAKAEGRYKGRPEDAERNDGIARMLASGQSWGSIQSATGIFAARYLCLMNRPAWASPSTPWSSTSLIVRWISLLNPC
jgi:DNA invertase Pin-like site-specific DNA recombinase